MHRLRLTSVFALFLFACGPPPTGTFSGSFKFAFEASRFEPDGYNEEWWLSGDTTPLRATVATPDFPAGFGCGKAEVEGDLSDLGAYGHRNQYDRELIVTRVVSITDIEMGLCF